MSTPLQDFYIRVSMTTTQFVAILDMLRNLRREGQALDYLDPTQIPTATETTPLTPDEQHTADTMQAVIGVFGVFEEQGIFADIDGAQKERAKKLYTVKRRNDVTTTGGV